MALQANQADFLTDEHAWIHRSMRLMTRATALEAHRCVLKCEGPAFVSMTSHATAIVSGIGLTHRLGDRPVRVVAVHAGHRPFGHSVMVGLLKGSPYIHVAGGALFIDPYRRARHQRLSAVCVHRMTSHAGNLVARVTRLDPAHMRGLIQVASQAYFVGGDRGYFCRVANILG